MDNDEPGDGREQSEFGAAYFLQQDMLSSGMVTLENGVLIRSYGNLRYMIEIKALDVTE